jgi:hypothetical protein
MEALGKSCKFALPVNCTSKVICTIFLGQVLRIRAAVGATENEHRIYWILPLFLTASIFLLFTFISVTRHTCSRENTLYLDTSISFLGIP